MSDLEYRVAKPDMKPGDVLVVKYDAWLSRETMDRIHKHFAVVIPGAKVLVLDSGVELSVLTAEDIAKRVAA